MLTKFDSYTTYLILNEVLDTEGVNKAAFNKMRRAFTMIITQFKFFAELLFNLRIAEYNGIPTMATDGKSIVYNPQFVNGLTDAETVFVIIHEIMHNANFHFARMGGRLPKLWNHAADYAINIQIDDMQKDVRKPDVIATPKNILLDEKYRNMNAEIIYDILFKEDPNQAGDDQGDGDGQGGDGDGQEGDGEGQDGNGQGKPGQGKPGQGKGKGKGKGKPDPNADVDYGPGGGGGTPKGDVHKPGDFEGKGKTVMEGNTDLEKTDKNNLEDAWKRIRIDASSNARGTGSASLDRWIRKATKPKVNWKAELKKFVAQIFDQKDYAYFNKRFIGRGDYLPGPRDTDKSTYENVVIAIDTSGSIGDDTLAKFGAEMLKLFKTYAIKKCYVIWCDYSIQSVQEFEVADNTFKLDKLKPRGGGGTSFVPPFKWIQDNILRKGKTPAFMVYFTDAYGDAPAVGSYGIRGYANRVLWVVIDNDTAVNLRFGKKIFLDKLP